MRPRIKQHSCHAAKPHTSCVYRASARKRCTNVVHPERSARLWCNRAIRPRSSSAFYSVSNARRERPAEASRPARRMGQDAQPPAAQKPHRALPNQGQRPAPQRHEVQSVPPPPGTRLELRPRPVPSRRSNPEAKRSCPPQPRGRMQLPPAAPGRLDRSRWKSRCSRYNRRLSSQSVALTELIRATDGFGFVFYESTR